MNQLPYGALELQFSAQRAKARNHCHHTKVTCPHSYIITPRGSDWNKESKASPAAILRFPANTCIFLSFPCASKATLVQGVKPEMEPAKLLLPCKSQTNLQQVPVSAWHCLPPEVTADAVALREPDPLWQGQREIAKLKSEMIKFHILTMWFVPKKWLLHFFRFFF